MSARVSAASNAAPLNSPSLLARSARCHQTSCPQWFSTNRQKDPSDIIRSHNSPSLAIPCHPLPSLAIPKHPGGKLFAAAQIAKRILTERRKWRRFFPDLYPLVDDQRWLSDFIWFHGSLQVDFIHPCLSLGCQTLAIAIHCNQVAPPMNFKKFLQKSWGINGRHFKKIQQAFQTYIFHHISIHIWLKYLKCQVKPSKIPQVYKFRVTNIEAFDWMHNSNSLFHLLHLRCSWMKMDGSLDVFEKINGKFYGTC